MMEVDAEQKYYKWVISKTTDDKRTHLKNIRLIVPQVYNGLLEKISKYILALKNMTGKKFDNLDKVERIIEQVHVTESIITGDAVNTLQHTRAAFIHWHFSVNFPYVIANQFREYFVVYIHL